MTRPQVGEVEVAAGGMENDYVRNHPELCPICEEMAASSDSLLWVPLGFAWEREGGLVVDPVVERRLKSSPG